MLDLASGFLMVLPVVLVSGFAGRWLLGSITLSRDRPLPPSASLWAVALSRVEVIANHQRQEHSVQALSNAAEWACGYSGDSP